MSPARARATSPATRRRIKKENVMRTLMVCVLALFVTLSMTACTDQPDDDGTGEVTEVDGVPDEPEGQPTTDEASDPNALVACGLTITAAGGRNVWYKIR